jgi:hypothetical protein
MRDNYVAKNANKFNIGGAHRDKSKYTRSTNLSTHEALSDLDDDLEEDWELEKESSEYFEHKYDDLTLEELKLETGFDSDTDLTTEETSFMFQEPYQFEDFE